MYIIILLFKGKDAHKYKLFPESSAIIIQMWAYILFFIFYCVLKFCAMSMHFTFIFRKKQIKLFQKCFLLTAHYNILKNVAYNATMLNTMLGGFSSHL